MPPRLHWGPYLLLPSCLFVHGGHSSSFHEVFSQPPLYPSVCSGVGVLIIFRQYHTSNRDIWQLLMWVWRLYHQNLEDVSLGQFHADGLPGESMPPHSSNLCNHGTSITKVCLFLRSSTCSIWSGWISVGDLPEQHLRPDSSLSDRRRHHLHRDALHIFRGQGCPLQNFWHCWRFLFQHRTTRPCARPRKRLLMLPWFLESSQDATLVIRLKKNIKFKSSRPDVIYF